MNGLVKKDVDAAQELQLVAFCLQGEEFAVDIKKVREVLKVTQITPLPQSTCGERCSQWWTCVSDSVLPTPERQEKPELLSWK
jgi:hypothetical protein